MIEPIGEGPVELDGTKLPETEAGRGHLMCVNDEAARRV